MTIKNENKYMTKENENWTSLKNFAPKLNLNHNIYSTGRGLKSEIVTSRLLQVVFNFSSVLVPAQKTTIFQLLSQVHYHWYIIMSVLYEQFMWTNY